MELDACIYHLIKKKQVASQFFWCYKGNVPFSTSWQRSSCALGTEKESLSSGLLHFFQNTLAIGDVKFEAIIVCSLDLSTLQHVVARSAIRERSGDGSYSSDHVLAYISPEIHSYILHAFPGLNYPSCTTPLRIAASFLNNSRLLISTQLSHNYPMDVICTPHH